MAKNIDPENLLLRIRECSRNDLPIDPALQLDLINAPKSALNWDIFYEILDVPDENATGYWNASIVAIRLLEPLLRKAYSSGSNRRINENFEDFIACALQEIQQSIATYDKSLSHFPNYIEPHITHLKCTYKQDTSYYLARKTGCRVYSQNALQEHAYNTSTSETSKDPYSQTESSFSVEEELDKRERSRRSKLFYMLNDKNPQIAASYWHLFLGGISNFPDCVIEDLYNRILKGAL